AAAPVPGAIKPARLDEVASGRRTWKIGGNDHPPARGAPRRPRARGPTPMPDSFQSLATIRVGEHPFRIHRLEALRAAGEDLDRLPFSLKVLLENLLRHEDGVSVTPDDILG